MMDMVPRPTRKWGIALLVMLCVSAILFITPWVASTVFFEPYDNWNNEGRFSRPEKQGNTTWLCMPSGPCVSCTPSEKQDSNFKCKPTGYHLPQKCVEDNEDARSAEKLGDSSQQRKDITERGEETYEEERSGRRLRRMLNHDDSRRKALAEEEGVQVYVLYKSCLPPEVREKLSVLGFEGVVLGLLAISGPFVYFRKRKIIPTQPSILLKSKACLALFSNAGSLLQFGSISAGCKTS
ncbi:hypothetical protein R1sor_006718 [Riccia sorocarpa]|uniref:Uncharacterized protein n=1 Tax=Riccia sorocarpa TaxID=122646 RepID=A0ABD3HR83_9MARC